ncbi:MAG: GntR family transcriptional regulator, partial [Oscillibacter sp.]|nr:GntR family transcriptional regulator [Oscillibacter sp.]
LENEGYIYSVAGRGSFVGAFDAAAEARREELRAQASALLRELHALGLPKEAAEAMIEEVYPS